MKPKPSTIRPSVISDNEQPVAGTGATTIDIDAYLATRGKVAVTWSIKDVRRVRPDLSHASAWEVLLETKHKHETGGGCSCSLIEDIAEFLFPQHYHDE